jgi:HSP20 family molecular chaperone IbpA
MTRRRRRGQDMLAPFSLNQMMREMDSMFPSGFGVDTTLPKLAVDIEERPDRYVIHADVPGMQSKDVKVHLSPENVLSIEAERTSHHEDGGPDSAWHKIERSYGTLHRSFQVPDHVDVNSITAEVKDGVLSLDLPKLEAAPKHELRQIPVNGATESP